jgi:hypothetical protein
VSLLTYKNGDGFRDPHWVLPSYTAKVLMRRVDKQGAPWIYNTWEPFERGINRDTVMELIDAASNMGIDIFTIDDGWQQEYGENAVNLTAFPGGLKPIIEKVEAKGMRLGLWIPLAAIGTGTADYKAHPEWAAQDQQGKPKITGTMAGPKAVMCLASPFRDAAAERVNQAIEQFHLAYVKLDLTTIFNAYGEAPGCWAKGHEHGDWAESLNMIYEGIAYVTGKVYAKHPDVLLDLTFELWGQKHVIDAGQLAAGDEQRGRQRAAFGRSFAGADAALSAGGVDAGGGDADWEHSWRTADDSGELCDGDWICSAVAGRSAKAERERPAVVSRQDRLVQEAAGEHKDQRELLSFGELVAAFARDVGRVCAAGA